MIVNMSYVLYIVIDCTFNSINNEKNHHNNVIILCNEIEKKAESYIFHILMDLQRN